MNYLLLSKLRLPLFESGNFHSLEKQKKQKTSPPFFPLENSVEKMQTVRWELPHHAMAKSICSLFYNLFPFFSVMPPIRGQSLHLYSRIPSTLTLCVCVCVWDPKHSYTVCVCDPKHSYIVCMCVYVIPSTLTLCVCVIPSTLTLCVCVCVCMCVYVILSTLTLCVCKRSQALWHCVCVCVCVCMWS